MAQLQVIVLERPIDTWSDLFTVSTFTKIVDLKLAGYSSRHPYGTLAIDRSDFFGDHVVVGDMSTGNFIPLTGWRSVTTEACRLFHTEFGAFSIVRNSLSHVKALTEIVESNNTKTIRYCSSYTVNPAIRDRHLLVQVKPLIAAMGYWFHSDYKTGVSIVAGNTEAKVDQMFEKVGYSPITLNDVVLPPFAIEALNGMEARIFTLKKWSEFTLEAAEKYKSLWDRRITKRAEKNITQHGIQRGILDRLDECTQSF